MNCSIAHAEKRGCRTPRRTVAAARPNLRPLFPPIFSPLFAFVFALVFALGPIVTGSAQGAPTSQGAPQARGGPRQVAITLIKGPSALAAAWFAERPPASPGAAISVSLAAGVDIVTAKLLSGEADMAVLPLNVAAKLYNAGANIRMAALVGGGMLSFLSTDASIKTLRDLRGKDIVMSGQKATPDYLFRFLMDKEGLKAQSDYTLVYNLAYPEAAAALAAGRISCAVLPEPFATQARILNPKLYVPFDIGALWTKATDEADYPMTVLVVSKILAETSPEIVEKILESYKASVEKTVQEPGATGILAERLDMGIKAAVATKAIPLSGYVFVEAAAARAQCEALLRVFLSFDPSAIGANLPDSGFYYRAGRK